MFDVQSVVQTEFARPFSHGAAENENGARAD